MRIKPLPGSRAPSRAFVEAISTLGVAHEARQQPCYQVAQQKLATLRAQILTLEAGIQAEDREPTGDDFKRLMDLLNVDEQPAHKYRFDLEIDTGRYTIQIDRAENYGYFEHNTRGDDSAGGLWFETRPSTTQDKRLELIEYDGTASLPKDVLLALREFGIEVSDDFA